MNRIFPEINYNNEIHSNTILEEFVLCENRRSKNIPEDYTIDYISNKEKYLQALAKKILESIWPKLWQKLVFNNEVEFLSEQSVRGGEADLVIIGNRVSLFIEAKRDPLMKIENDKIELLTKGEEARNQVKEYKPIDFNDQESQLRYGILGKKKFDGGVIRVGIFSDKTIVFELNSSFSINDYVNF